jgi:uncharacterized protein
MGKRGWILALSFLAATASCVAKPSTVVVSIGSVKVNVEIADTDAERMKGLMFRKAVPEGTGMLFVFEKDEKLSFWMKNTEVPLSIAYITSDGTVSQILDMQPFSLAPVPSERYVRFALEVPQGWFAKVGVKVGDKVEIPQKWRS